MIKITNEKPFPPLSNPFEHDKFHMGTMIGTNVALLRKNHDKETCDYLYLVNVETGERIKVSFTQFK